MHLTPFQPPTYLKPAIVQTLLASLKIRTWGRKNLLYRERQMILETREETRLLGLYSPQSDKKHRGLAILLHGWEGSSQSTYMVTCGDFLYRNGFSVFRLNFRDHGSSHHLNKGLFYATLLDEVWDAVHQASNFGRGAPVYLVGFSLGGNFAIRIAAKYAGHDTCKLRRVVSISPVLDPDKATDMIDSNPLILHYFLKKWRRSLILKQTLYPDHYDFTGILKMGSLREMTARLLERYTDYAGTHEYFHAYSIQPELTQQITLPLTILTAADDPIIPIEEFQQLKPSAGTDVIMLEHGGHNGFIEGLFQPAWYDRFLLQQFEADN
ncbi:YheT family hydrolase [Thermodesulfobacteriota bacterium]